MVKDFPDVFPEELPGMPPDRDIECLIELLPGTLTNIKETVLDARKGFGGD